jgi:hypothetical protein
MADVLGAGRERRLGCEGWLSGSGMTMVQRERMLRHKCGAPMGFGDCNSSDMQLSGGIAEKHPKLKD